MHVSQSKKLKQMRQTQEHKHDQSVTPDWYVVNGKQEFLSKSKSQGEGLSPFTKWLSFSYRSSCFDTQVEGSILQLLHVFEKHSF